MLCLTTSFLAFLSHAEDAYLVDSRVWSKPPSIAQLTEKTIVNPRIIDKSGKEKLIYWNGVGRNFRNSNQPLTLEIRNRISAEIGKSNSDFFLSKKDDGVDPNLPVVIAVVAKVSRRIPYDVKFIQDFISEDDPRVVPSKQKLLTAILKTVKDHEFSASQILITLSISNFGNVVGLSVSDYYGSCNPIASATLNRNKKSFEAVFDFEINLNGKAVVTKKEFLVNGEETRSFFDAWIDSCTFDVDVFAGTNHKNQRVRVLIN